MKYFRGVINFFVIALCFVVLMPISASSSDQVNEEDLKFVHALQRAVRERDKKWIA